VSITITLSKCQQFLLVVHVIVTSVVQSLHEYVVVRIEPDHDRTSAEQEQLYPTPA
jgi:hypothetical protein